MTGFDIFYEELKKNISLEEILENFSIKEILLIGYLAGKNPKHDTLVEPINPIFEKKNDVEIVDSSVDNFPEDEEISDEQLELSQKSISEKLAKFKNEQK